MPGYANRRSISYLTEVALGIIDGHSSVNKYGEAPDGVQTTATDIWSRADATPTQQIWLAPTAARVHALASSNAGDNGQVVRVWGLPSWSTNETSQDITLPSNTTALVIIHRMKFISSAAVPINLGTITATAATDNTVTAVILPGEGQTEMAIYGVPSTKKALLRRWGMSIDKAQSAVVAVDFSIRVNENPDVQTTGFLRKMDDSLMSNGANSKDKRFEVPPVYPGPCIIKVQAIGSAADIDAQSDFDLELVPA